MRLPSTLTHDDDTAALALLECYYGKGAHAHHQPFTGAWFDTWDSTGTRTQDVNRFTADDLVAVSLLSVDIAGAAARQLLDVKADTFAALLVELGPDRDLVAERVAWADDWAGWRLWKELMKLPDVGPTRASKLYARKRPRLRPIYDTVIARVLGTQRLWEPLRTELQRDSDLHPRLERLREQSRLSPQVSAIRIFDVLAWMEGTYGPNCPWPKNSQL
jgi:hypothetical protein